VTERILIETAEDDVRSARRRRRSWAPVIAVVLMIAGWSVASTGTSEEPDPDPALLPEPFAPPEGTWVEIPFSGEGALTSVLDSGDGLIAAGSGRRVDATPLVWVSTDGARWTEATGPWRRGDLIASLVKGPAGYLAGGYQIDQSFRGNLTDAEPRIWSSSDGTFWELSAIIGLPDGGVVTDLAAAADAVIAIGWEGPTPLEPLAAPIPEVTPRVWSSDDGITWVDITPDGAASWFADVAVTPFGFAVGGADDQGASIWAFEEGEWAHLPTPEPTGDAVTALTWHTDALVALTRSASDPEALVFVWSVDGDGSWTAAPTGSDSPGMGGWLATIDGDLYAASAFTRSVISMGPEVFVSRNGTEWAPVEVTSGLTPWPPPRIMSVLRFEGDLFAFGSRGPSPAAWRLVEDRTSPAG
jgi:hypothetical protein